MLEQIWPQSKVEQKYKYRYVEDTDNIELLLHQTKVFCYSYISIATPLRKSSQPYLSRVNCLYYVSTVQYLGRDKLRVYSKLQCLGLCLITPLLRR